MDEYAETTLPPPRLNIPPNPDWVRLPMYPARGTYGLLAAIAVVFIAVSVVYGGINATENADVLIKVGAKVNWKIIENHEYWRLITAMFLHIGIPHILINGWSLYILGVLIERFYGLGRFLAIYFIAGLGGSIASFALSPDSISAGASGAIVGLLGAMIAYFGLHRRLLGAQGRSYLLNGLFNVGFMVLTGVFLAGVVDNWAHIGGLVTGAIAGLALAPRYRPGRQLAPGERLLEDAQPRWVPWAMTGGLTVLTLLVFAAALRVLGG
jgi:rhomboid protease GluP